LHNTHLKSNRQTLFLYSEKKNSWQTVIGQKFRLTREPKMQTPAFLLRGHVTGCGCAFLVWSRLIGFGLLVWWAGGVVQEEVP